MSKSDTEQALFFGELRAADTIAFANEPLAERRWEKWEKGCRVFSNRLLYEVLGLFQLLHPEDAGAGMPPIERVSPRGLARAQALQADLRAALEAVARERDLPDVLAEINRESPFGYMLVPAFHHDKGSKLTETFFRWIPDERGTGRHHVMRALADTLVAVGARRIRQCDHETCRRFFLAKRLRMHRHAQHSFCSPRCSTAYWNEKRLASGYFTKKRQENRERQRAARVRAERRST